MTSYREVWLNSQTNLWVMGDEPEYLYCCQVDEILWGTALLRVCPYCGSDTNGKCPNCGGVGGKRVVYRADKARVRVSGMLPEASCLFFLPKGSTLEVQHIDCGRRDEHFEDATILRFIGCEVVERKMENVVILSPDNADALCLNVKLECAAELVLKNED